MNEPLLPFPLCPLDSSLPPLPLCLLNSSLLLPPLSSLDSLPSLLLPSLSLPQCSLNYFEFACQLVEGLTVVAILSAVLKLAQYTTSLPLEKPHLATCRRGHVIFDPASHSTKQLLHFQYTIYHVMGGIVGGAGLAQKVSIHGCMLPRCRVHAHSGVFLPSAQ